MDSLLTLSAKAAMTDNNIRMVNEQVKTTPELANFPSRTVSGTHYYYLRHKDGDGSSVGFREANNGIASSSDNYELVIAQMYILAARVELDKAVEDAYPGGPSAYEREITMRKGREVAAAIGHRVWYGDDASSTGFNGFAKLLGTTAASSGGRVVFSDTTSAANNTSVYLVRYGDEGVSFDFGNNSTIRLSQFRTESIIGKNNEKHPGRVADISGWMGMRLATVEGAMRIANVREESGKVGLSDKMVANALRYWRGAPPSAIYMNRTAAYLLQCSRTHTTVQGPSARVSSALGPFAPFPTESQGIPIVITDALTDSEAFVS